MLHFGTTPSPLLEKGSGFLTPYAGSEWAKALGSGEPRRERRGQGGTRVLFLTYGAPTFVKGLIAALEDDGEVSCRLIDLALSPAHRELVDVRRLTQARAAHLATGQGVEVPPDLREAIEEADVVFVEWGHRAALWASMITDLRARLVVRIHAYEARTALPQLIAWENVDDVIFVADHVRALVEETAPGIARAGRISTLPNAFHAAQFTLPKLPGAEHTLGLVSWNSVVKDAAWALEVLAALRETDPSWRLLLVGDSEFPAEPAGHADRITALLAEAGDSVEMTGFRTDIPEVLRGVGVILSSSLSEGTHQAVAEGAASGALPVVRDWPHVASWGGARGVYPDQWVVGSISDAVARIGDPSGPDG